METDKKSADLFDIIERNMNDPVRRREREERISKAISEIRRKEREAWSQAKNIVVD